MSNDVAYQILAQSEHFEKIVSADTAPDDFSSKCSDWVEIWYATTLDIE